MTDEELRQLILDTARETRSHVDDSAAETRSHVDDTARETRSHVDDSAAETRSHFDAVSEGLRHHVQIVAEGVNALSGRVDRLEGTMQHEFEESRSMIRLSYTELDRRLRNLEETVSSLQARVERIEQSTH